MSMVVTKKKDVNVKSIIATSFDYTVEEVAPDTNITYTTKDFNDIKYELAAYDSKCYYGVGDNSLFITQGMLLGLIDRLITNYNIPLISIGYIKKLLHDHYSVIWHPEEDIHKYITIIKDKKDDLEYDMYDHWYGC